jgi:hypothetical protein
MNDNIPSPREPGSRTLRIIGTVSAGDVVRLFDPDEAAALRAQARHVRPQLVEHGREES